MIRMKKNAHILVIRFSAMGDVAMTVPVLRRLVSSYPALKITVLTKPFFTPIFNEIPNVSVVGADVKTKYKGFLGLWKLASELNALEFDGVADLHNVLRSKILRFFFFFYGIKHASINKGRDEKKALTQLGPKKIHPLKTTHERYAQVFETLGFPIDLSKAVAVPKPKLTKNVLELLGNSSKKWIGIAPFAAHTSKMYPMDLMEQVIAYLNETNQYKLLLFGGGKEEKSLGTNLSSKYLHLTSLVGKLSFEEELNLIANLDLMLSMDSGNGHLAALFNVPVVTLWGATHPYAGFAPFGQSEENQLLPDLEQYPYIPTSIYGNKEVDGYEDAMRSIPPKKVIEKLNALL